MEDALLDITMEDRLSGFNEFFGPEDVEDFDVEEDVEDEGDFDLDDDGRNDDDPNPYEGTLSEE